MSDILADQSPSGQPLGLTDLGLCTRALISHPYYEAVAVETTKQVASFLILFAHSSLFSLFSSSQVLGFMYFK